MNIWWWIYVNIIIIKLIPNAGSILNGERAGKDDFKYQVKLELFHDAVCSGAIITESHILTAAHCLKTPEKIATANDVQVFVGSRKGRLDDEIPLSRVKRINLHEQYKPVVPASCTKIFFQELIPELLGDPSLDKIPPNDIAVLTLEDPLHLVGNLESISYEPTSSLSRYNCMCEIAGWGLYTRKYHPAVLRSTYYSILTSDECTEAGIPHRANEFCGIDKSGRTSLMQGDSGGPLVCNGVLVGVVSTSFHHRETGVMTHIPVVFADVSKHIPFIKKILAQK